MASRRAVAAAWEPGAQAQIRPLRRQDSIEELTTVLHRSYAALARMGLNYTAADQAPDTTRRRVALGQCFVAMEDTKLVGTILVNPVVPNPLGDCFGRPEVASIHQFAVAPEFQGRGLGSLLLAHAEGWVKKQGFTEVALDAAQSAPQLVAFYVRRGYRSVGRIQWSGKSYRSIIMSKELPRGA